MSGALPACLPAGAASEPLDWDAVRDQFDLDNTYVHLSALLIASHPRRVRDAIDNHRRELDRNPVLYLGGNRRRQEAARAAAASYLDARPDDIALTDSTTMGLGLVYNGLRLRAGDELLTTEHDYFVTHESLRLAADAAGATVRRVALYERSAAGVSAEGIVDTIARAVTPATRVVALTWVHSGTGLKLPLRPIADAIVDANAGRDEADRIRLCVDGVHGFGVEDATVDDLGADVFVSGCHKWLFGPRGTGLVWARREAWAAMRPTIPSFVDDATWQAWIGDEPRDIATTAATMTPGGFKAFEHQWALDEAFAFHTQIGKARVATRTHALAGRLKDGLAGISGITLHTPRTAELSSGIVCFEVNGANPWRVVARLREQRILATVTPYAARYVRLTPSIRNSPEEIDAALRAVRALA